MILLLNVLRAYSFRYPISDELENIALETALKASESLVREQKAALSRTLGGFMSCLTPSLDDSNSNSHSRNVIGEEAWQNRDAWGRDEWNTWETWGWYRQFVRAVSGAVPFSFVVPLFFGMLGSELLVVSHALSLVCTLFAQIHEYARDSVVCAARWFGWSSRKPFQETMVYCHWARIDFVTMSILFATPCTLTINRLFLLTGRTK